MKVSAIVNHALHAVTKIFPLIYRQLGGYGFEGFSPVNIIRIG
jgi:hypothetical protein